ncbi:hypothetical protein [Kribbella sp. CA-294648]|uniref:hypothetical protein n=1 Tax=Kribbella sp. CA-294648 TaxID=3239948 RepID=UPI003D93F9AE
MRRRFQPGLLHLLLVPEVALLERVPGRPTDEHDSAMAQVEQESGRDLARAAVVDADPRLVLGVVQGEDRLGMGAKLGHHVVVEQPVAPDQDAVDGAVAEQPGEELAA